MKTRRDKTNEGVPLTVKTTTTICQNCTMEMQDQSLIFDSQIQNFLKMQKEAKPLDQLPMQMG